MTRIANEILTFSYWEHFKASKDIALILPLDHPRRLELEEEKNKLLDKINELNVNNKTTTEQ